MKKFLLSIAVILWATTLQAAVTAWVHPYMVPMNKEAAVPLQPEKTMSLKVTPGEYEPAVFALRSDIEDSVVVALSGLEGEDWLPSCWCELHKVVSMNDSTQPNRLFEYTNPVRLAAGKTQFFWLTVHPPEGARPGTYVGRVFLKAGHVAQTLEITCEVLPFTLQKNRIVGGAFMSETNLPPGWYQDMKEHGMDAVQSFWAWEARITRRGEKVVIDLSPLDEYVSDLNATGMRGPVVISLGNAYHLHYERRIAEAFGMPIDTGQVGRYGLAMVGPQITPKLDSLFVDGLHQIRDNWKNKDYPQELVVLIYDEPTMILLERYKNRFALFKTAMPEVRVYGVVMDKRSLAESILDYCDIIVCNGDFDANRELARENHKGLYVYGTMGNVNYARFRMGCMPWRVGADGAFFWMYNYWTYPNTCAVYRHPDDPNKLVRSTPWEGVREGVDDLRYFATAERLIERATAEKKEAAWARLDQIKGEINPEYRGRPPRGQAQDEQSVLGYYNEAQRIREEVIKIILDLL